jgi:hypothetical protein
VAGDQLILRPVPVACPEFVEGFHRCAPFQSFQAFGRETAVMFKVNKPAAALLRVETNCWNDSEPLERLKLVRF